MPIEEEGLRGESEMADEKNTTLADEKLSEAEGGAYGYCGYLWCNYTGTTIRCRGCGHYDTLRYRYDFGEKIYECSKCKIEFKDEKSFHAASGTF
jgi:hypothetical protein